MVLYIGTKTAGINNLRAKDPQPIATRVLRGDDVKKVVYHI
jgi:hypothetical protein